jgi:hypothetical protein
LPEVARFDADGLWRHREIGFSRSDFLISEEIGLALFCLWHHARV